jgi:hypothetical protein
LNSREFLTQALLSSHRVILDKLLADVDITEANEDVHQELSEQAAGIADTYAGTLMLQWRSLMGFSEHCDREHLEEGEESSTENLTRPSVAPLN